MRKIKLMADYHCFPLWEASPEAVGNIDPNDLPISSSLRQRLAAWAEKFDATLNRNDPVNSGFKDKDAAAEFQQEKEAIAKGLRQELGPDFYVV